MRLVLVSLYLGHDIFSPNARFLDGAIDNFKLLNRALSDQEISDGYKTDASGSEMVIIGMNFDSKGATAYDVSPNELDGTIYNANIFDVWDADGRILMGRMTLSNFGH